MDSKCFRIPDNTVVSLLKSRDLKSNAFEVCAESTTSMKR